MSQSLAVVSRLGFDVTEWDGHPDRRTTEGPITPETGGRLTSGPCRVRSLQVTLSHPLPQDRQVPRLELRGREPFPIAEIGDRLDQRRTE